MYYTELTIAMRTGAPGGRAAAAAAEARVTLLLPPDAGCCSAFDSLRRKTTRRNATNTTAVTPIIVIKKAAKLSPSKCCPIHSILFVECSLGGVLETFTGVTPESGNAVNALGE